MLAGACSYLRELTPESIPLIYSRGQIAWSQLRRRIVFPTTQDVALLAVGRRNLDFGMDESAEFTSQLDKGGRSLCEKLSVARASMWPEGEIRKQFPRAAGLFLVGSELLRLIRAPNRESVFDGAPWRAWVSCLDVRKDVAMIFYASMRAKRG